MNLKNSFPDKSITELKAIRFKFYRYLCDLFLETFKTLTIRKSISKKRVKVNSQAKELFTNYLNKKQSVIIVMGHYGNWEWGGNAFAFECPQQLYIIYHPLKNKYFNNLIYHIRTRFGNKLYAMNDTFKEMVKNRNEVNATAFIADQTPSPENAHWLKFLNQDTPVFLGTEKIAKKLNFPIVYVTITRPRRGYYEVFAETLVENPKDTKDGVITELHTRRLEQDIIKQPELWLWSHRRWKHKRPLN